jgi:hypothetical protein
MGTRGPEFARLTSPSIGRPVSREIRPRGVPSVALVDVETPALTEVRLIGALRAADCELLEGEFAWQRIDASAFPAAVAAGAVALARNGQQWSQLAPAVGDRAETWALLSLRFSPGTNVDGFVAWFAAHLRRRIGPRLILANQFVAESGRAAFLWGVPPSARHALTREVAILKSPSPTGVRGIALM